MQTLDRHDLEKIHQASMAILKRAGVVFNNTECLDIFKKNGVKVEGQTVFPTEEQIMAALAQAPESFTVKSLNPEKNITIGGGGRAMLPAYGPPFITLPGGEQRVGTFSDYEDFVKLVHTSQVLNMNGFLMIEPSDCDVRSAHLDMFLSGFLGCDKPLMGTPLSRKAARDCVELLAVAFGGRDQLMDAPATVSLCNSLSPLQFSDDMASSIVELTQGGQAVCVAALIMAGTSGPITIPGVLALANAEVLAGLTLAQLVRPGAPVIYGTSSSVMDPRSGALSVGAPEMSIIISMAAQLAKYYKLPSRSGGGLSDAMITDAQAGAESALALFNAINSGIDFILNSVGILGSYIAISKEKFILDEEVASMIQRMTKLETISDETLDVDSIIKVGPGGHYLTEKRTFNLCRQVIYQTGLMSRANYGNWKAAGGKTLEQSATEKVTARLAMYTAPDVDRTLKRDLLSKASVLAGGASLKIR